MSRIPRITGSDLLAALATAGFAVIRVKGSHHFLAIQRGASAFG
jgi:predicted RNA binding protein YcfA (HicA-like mRNA interferase family)